MNILALSTNYKYHQDLLESLRQKGIVTEWATSHKPDLDAQRCEYYKKYGTKLVNGKAFYRVNTLQKLVPADAPPLTEEIIKAFEAVERDFYTLSDRYAYFPKPFRYTKRLFRYAIRYWLDFYAKNNIEGVYSICSPHNFPDFLAFHVAKYLGIKTLLTNDVMINDHVWIIEDYRQQFKVPTDYLTGKSNEEIIATLGNKYAEKAFAESNQIRGTKILNDVTLKLSNVNIAAPKQIKSMTSKPFLIRARKFISPDIFKPKFKAAFAMNGELSDFKRRFIRLQAGQRLKSIKKSYEKFAVYPDYSRKFIYFAMHLSPERTTQPEAEIFEDHYLAIEILSKSVPDDWLIYVKENPSQYGKKLNLINGKHYRDRSDYLEFIRLPNVRLIRQDVKTKDLIENAAIVASPKGSVGWESITANKPCIVFANAWYSACRSAYRVSDVKSCKTAIEEIITKTHQEVLTDKLKFLSYMQPHFVIGSMGGHFNLEFATEPYENQVENLASVISSRLKP